MEVKSIGKAKGFFFSAFVPSGVERNKFHIHCTFKRGEGSFGFDEFVIIICHHPEYDNEADEGW